MSGRVRQTQKRSRFVPPIGVGKPIHCTNTQPDGTSLTPMGMRGEL